jgi:hypothetical protein
MGIQSLRPELAKVLTAQELALYDHMVPFYTPEARYILDSYLLRALGNVAMPYQANQAANIKMARALRKAGIKVSAKDKFRMLWVLVDPQKDFTQPFCYLKKVGRGYEPRFVLIEEWKSTYQLLPHMEEYVEWVPLAQFDKSNYENIMGGRLSVPNAWVDMRNILVFGYIMFGFINQFMVSGDAHGKKSGWSRHQYVARYDATVDRQFIVPDYQVKAGEYPREFTFFYEDTIYHPTHNPSGLWQPTRHTDMSHTYITETWKSQRQEVAEGKKGSDLEIIPPTIWDEHCNRGSDGANPEGVIWELTDLHAHTRDADTIDEQKSLGFADQFGIFSPQVLLADDPYGQVNVSGLEVYSHFDAVGESGEALYNCVIRTQDQQMVYIVQNAPDQAGKLTSLEGTSSPIPGTEAIGKAIEQRLMNWGMRKQNYVEYGFWLIQQHEKAS